MMTQGQQKFLPIVNGTFGGEIFIDEDNSGGNHQFNFNAFAYHIALDNQAVDIGFEDAPNGPFLLLKT